MCQTVSASKFPLVYLAFKPEQFLPGKGLTSLAFCGCNFLGKSLSIWAVCAFLSEWCPELQNWPVHPKLSENRLSRIVNLQRLWLLCGFWILSRKTLLNANALNRLGQHLRLSHFPHQNLQCNCSGEKCRAVWKEGQGRTQQSII